MNKIKTKNLSKNLQNLIVQLIIKLKHNRMLDIIQQNLNKHLIILKKI